jgi:hypothetical protein
VESSGFGSLGTSTDAPNDIQGIIVYGLNAILKILRSGGSYDLLGAAAAQFCLLRSMAWKKLLATKAAVF